MEQWVSAVSRYHPSFREGLEGCSPEELVNLEALVGGALPAPYAEFLRVMGRRMGDLALYDADFRIGTLADYHARHGAPEDPGTDLVIGIARHGPFGGRSFEDEVSLELDDESGTYVVIANPPEEREHEFPEEVRVLDLVQTSLHELLFAKAFLQYRWPRFENRQRLFIEADRREGLARAASALMELGFELHPESDTVRYFERTASVVIVSPNPGEPVRLTLGSLNARELRHLEEALAARLPLVPG